MATKSVPHLAPDSELAKRVKQEAEEVTKGSAFDDEGEIIPPEDDPNEWSGEVGSPKASIDQHKTHIPQTHDEIEKEVLSEKNLSQEIVNILTSRVEKAILRTSGAGSRTLVQMVDDKLAKHMSEIEKWSTAQSKRLTSLEESQQTSSENAIARIDEKLASLELRIETLAGSIYKQGAEESRMIHEAYEMIRARQTSDAPVDDHSDPSIYQRFEQRAETLNEHLRQMEPQIETVVQKIEPKISQKNSAKRRIGRPLM